MKNWVRYTLIGTISLVVIVVTTFGAQRWAYSQGIKEIKEGGAQNLKKGIGHLELAFTLGKICAVQETAEDQYNLGSCYYQGEGVSQDFGKAAKWFQRAADQGNIYAQNMLGICYLNGQGVPKDYVKSFMLFKSAAEQGFSVAQFNLGSTYQQGKNFQKDLNSAVKWYRKAAEQGNPQAQRALKDPEVVQYEQTEQVAEAKQQAEDAIPLYTAEDLARQLGSNAGRFISEFSGKKIRMAGKLGFIGSNSIAIFNNNFTCFNVDGLYNLANFHEGEPVTITCVFTGDGSFDESTKMATFQFHGVSIRN